MRNDPLAERHYHWGKDIIGTAFRRREPVFYLKRDDDSVGVRLIDLPGAIQAMIAVPVNAPYPDNEWPVAVLVLASFDPDSVLEALLRDKSTAAGLADWISNRSGDLMMVPPESAEPISEPRT